MEQGESETLSAARRAYKFRLEGVGSPREFASLALAKCVVTRNK
jgi:hypothetical protein